VASSNLADTGDIDLRIDSESVVLVALSVRDMMAVVLSCCALSCVGR